MKTYIFKNISNKYSRKKMFLEIDCYEKKYKEANRNDVEDRENNSGGPFLPPIPTSIAVVGDFKRDHMMRAAKNMVFSLTMAQP